CYMLGAGVIDETLDCSALAAGAWLTTQVAGTGAPIVHTNQTIGRVNNPVAAQLLRRMVRTTGWFTLTDPMKSVLYLERNDAPTHRTCPTGPAAFSLRPADERTIDRYLLLNGLNPL